MTRLPIPGSDDGIWGELLNDFLEVSHENNGTLKPDTVSGDNIVDGVVSSAKLADSYMPATSVKDYGALGDGTTDDTAAIQNALNQGATNGQKNIYFPAGTYKITAALAVSSGATITGTGATIQQTTWKRPVFDCLDADNVTIHGLKLAYTGASRTMDASAFRGSNEYVYSAGVWANGSRVTVRDCYIDRFVCGVFLSAWNTGSSAYDQNGHVGNRVLDVECNNADFGILYLGQYAMEIGGLYVHDNLDASGGVNPTHAIYGSGTASVFGDKNSTIHDCRCDGNTGLYAYQMKYIYGGTYSNLTADSCNGLLYLQDAYDLAVTGLSIQNSTLVTASGEASVKLSHATTFSARVSISNVRIKQASGRRAVLLLANDSTYSQFSVEQTTTSNPTNDYTVLLRGNRNKMINLNVTETNDATALPLTIGFGAEAADANILQSFTTRGGSSTVTIGSGATATQVDPIPPSVGHTEVLLTTGACTLDRRTLDVTNAAAAAQRLVLTYFTAQRSETITALAMATASIAAGATPTLVRLGVYSVAGGGGLTLVASTTNDTSLFATTFTRYQKSLSASWNKIAGQRYAIGILIDSGAALPNFYGAVSAKLGGSSILDTELSRDPRDSGEVSGQSDLPASVTSATVGMSRRGPLYIHMVP